LLPTAWGALIPYVTVGRENSGDIRIYYEDHGQGIPVVLVHGYLLDGHSWEKQEAALRAAGCRVLTYDRRGFGASSRPSTGYDYDTLAADLGALLQELDLREVVLAGFCSGAGEVLRYLGSYGRRRVRAAALLAPFLLGVDGHEDKDGRGPLDEFAELLAADRPAATKSFLDLSYNIDLLGGTTVSDQAWQNSFHVAVGASAAAVVGCSAAWREDFHDDLARIDIPVLIVQGGQDRVAPPEATMNALSRLPGYARRLLIPDGPHAIIWTHADEVNRALLSFIASV
jgi:non-heme chloroperoxidase